MIVITLTDLILHATDRRPCLSAVQLDRFIPSRSALDVDVSSYNLLKENAFAAEIPQKVCIHTTKGMRQSQTWLHNTRGYRRFNVE